MAVPNEPITRKEMFLAKAVGQETDTPNPITREEMYLDALANGGGGGSGGSSIPTWTLLGEYNFAELKGDNESWSGTINLTDLGGLSKIYLRWTGMGNISSSASSLEFYINNQSISGSFLIPTAKAGSTTYGYTRLYYNGLTWEITTVAGAISASNDSKVNAQTVYNEKFNVGACESIKIRNGSAQYNPDRGVLSVYGAK